MCAKQNSANLNTNTEVSRAMHPSRRSQYSMNGQLLADTVQQLATVEMESSASQKLSHTHLKLCDAIHWHY